MNIESFRVVFVSDAMTSRNGVGTYYQDLVSHLSGYLHTVDLIAPCEYPAEPHQGFSFAIPGDRTQRLYFPKYHRVVQRLRELQPHVIVFPTLGPYTVFCIRYARRMGVPVCVGKHTNFEKLAGIYCNRVTGAIFQKVVKWISAWMLSQGDAIITNDIEDQSQMSDQSNVHLVGTPISKLFLDTQVVPTRHVMRKALFLGRLGPEKNVLKLLQSVEQLPDIQFYIGGDGPLRKQVESMAIKCRNLTYLGWLPRGQVVKIIDDTDLLVLPSVIESFGSVALEAMSRARNVLISRNCGIKNWPILAENLFYWEDIEPLSEAIMRVVNSDFQLRQTFANNGRRAAREITDSAIEDWLNVFRKVTQRSLSSRLVLRRAS